MGTDAAIRIICPHCSETLEAEASMRGVTATCPACHKVITIPSGLHESPKLPKQSRVREPAKPKFASCRSCGTRVAFGRVFCAKCDRDLNGTVIVHRDDVPAGPEPQEV